jgi:hypothetical protein
MEVSGQLHGPVALLPGKEYPVTHWIGSWVDTRDGFDTLEKIKITASVGNQTLVVQPIA